MHFYPSARAASRGARLLDRKEPGWAAYVDPRTVNIADGIDCTLGQVGRNKHGYSHIPYSRMVEQLGLFGEEWKMGFIPRPGIMLDVSWRREIRARQRRARREQRAAVHVLAA